jgi:hypothetical protein
MKKTTNYQLNQWDETDRILREDFNADNAKIDAAIAEASPLTKILDVTISQAAQQIDLDVSEIHFENYYELILYAEVTQYVDMRLNNCNGSSDYCSATDLLSNNSSIFASLMKAQSGMNCLHIFSTRDNYIFGTVLCMSSSYSGTNFFFSRSFSNKAVNANTLLSNQLKTMNFYSSNGIPAGSRFVMMGVKK